MPSEALSPELFRAAFEAAPDPILLVRRDGTIAIANAAAQRVFGYSPAELVGQQVEILVPDSLRGTHADHRARYDKTPTPREMGGKLDLVARCKDGSEVPVDVSLSPVELAEGRFVVCIARDVREKRALEQQLREASYRDSVTGLYSRAFFEAELDRLDGSRLFPVTCFMFDVVQMKQVNDTQGHQAGDDLLRRCAEALRGCFRSEDLVARIGGDEFAAVVAQMTEPQATEWAARCGQALAGARLSWGSATGEKAPVRDILVKADLNMYDARERRNRPRSPQVT
ncbi:MAG: diguanylate cyclase domain-containing protein [Myxococcaceae bacterium]